VNDKAMPAAVAMTTIQKKETTPPKPKKTNSPKLPQDTNKNTDLLHLGASPKPKKKAETTLEMGAAIGKSSKKTAPTSPKPKKKKEATLEMDAAIGKNPKKTTPTPPTPKKTKPSSDDSFFSI